MTWNLLLEEAAQVLHQTYLKSFTFYPVQLFKRQNEAFSKLSIYPGFLGSIITYSDLQIQFSLIMINNLETIDCCSNFSATQPPNTTSLQVMPFFIYFSSTNSHFLSIVPNVLLAVRLDIPPLTPTLLKQKMPQVQVVTCG